MNSLPVGQWSWHERWLYPDQIYDLPDRPLRYVQAQARFQKELERQRALQEQRDRIAMQRRMKLGRYVVEEKEEEKQQQPSPPLIVTSTRPPSSSPALSQRRSTANFVPAHLSADRSPLSHSVRSNPQARLVSEEPHRPRRFLDGKLRRDASVYAQTFRDPALTMRELSGSVRKSQMLRAAAAINNGRGTKTARVESTNSARETPFTATAPAVAWSNGSSRNGTSRQSSDETPTQPSSARGESPPESDVVSSPLTSSSSSRTRVDASGAEEEDYDDEVDNVEEWDWNAPISVGTLGNGFSGSSAARATAKQNQQQLRPEQYSFHLNCRFNPAHCVLPYETESQRAYGARNQELAERAQKLDPTFADRRHFAKVYQREYKEALMKAKLTKVLRGP